VSVVLRANMISCQHIILVDSEQIINRIPLNGVSQAGRLENSAPMFGNCTLFLQASTASSNVAALSSLKGLCDGLPNLIYELSITAY
jgi:hypothetical protein